MIPNTKCGDFTCKNRYPVRILQRRRNAVMTSNGAGLPAACSYNMYKNGGLKCGARKAVFRTLGPGGGERWEGGAGGTGAVGAGAGLALALGWAVRPSRRAGAGCKQCFCRIGTSRQRSKRSNLALKPTSRQRSTLKRPPLDSQYVQ